MRIDIFLVEKGMVKSRTAAKEIIQSGGVEVNGKMVSKPSYEVSEQDDIVITADTPRYVGRGGLKLEKAIEAFGISLNGLVCMDIGASTGGFTDCMLQYGAEFVYAVDVGHDQLDEKLKNDGRVKNMEGFNIRNAALSDFERKIDFISTDVSFISLTMVIPKITELLVDGSGAVMLIKPQFECGKADIGKKGIVRSPKVHERVIREIAAECEKNQLGVQGIDFSPIQGGDGNIEYLIYAVKKASGKCFDIASIVRSAHSLHKGTS